MNRFGKHSLSALAMLVCSLPTFAQQADTSYHGRKAWKVQNEKVQVVVLPGGGHIASITLRSGSGANLNPLWLPPWQSVEPGNWQGGKYGDKPGAQLLSAIMGHNLCLDFFGGPSAAETKAGIPAHGEAPTVNWTAVQQSATKLTYTTLLPKAQMRVTRTISLTPGSSALWIKETAENLTDFDRPIGWNQHVTLGPPFLEAGASFYDMNGKWSMVDPKEFSKGQRLKQGAEFDWPNVPAAKGGGTIDLRDWPQGSKSSDFSTTLIDPTAKWGWFTAINTKKHLLIGYIWPRADWPWAANWEENKFRTGVPWLGKAVTRGIEFGTTPFAYSRKDTVTMGKLHDTPTYRWISARNAQTVSYGAFVAPLPSGATGVKSVEIAGGSIKITLAGADKTLSLPLKR